MFSYAKSTIFLQLVRTNAQELSKSAVDNHPFADPRGRIQSQRKVYQATLFHMSSARTKSLLEVAKK